MDEKQKAAADAVTLNLDLIIAVRELQADMDALKRVLFSLDLRAEPQFTNFSAEENKKAVEYLSQVRQLRELIRSTIPETPATPDKVN